MNQKEFEAEQKLEQKAELQELQDLKNEYQVPNWQYPEEDDTIGYYTGNRSKTLRQHKGDIQGLL